MAVFGVPTAFEDAPLRACRSALAILQRLKATGGELEAKHGVRPRLRIGLNTGLAVVGQVEGGADAAVTVLGDTVNFAARLQALAEPGAVFMSEATSRLVQGMVEANFAGEHAIKGKSEQQKVYRLDAIRQGATRFEAAVSRGLSAFVGRERELEVLERALAEARSELRVVDLVAEPGMGKSRLLHEFRQRVGKERAFVLSGSCSPNGQQTAFLPFIEVVRGSFRVSAGEPEKDVARHRWVTDGVLYNLVASDVAISLSKVFQGHIGEGIHSLEKAITKLEFEGYRVGADEVRLYLAEVYLQIIAGNEKLPLLTLLKNLPILLKVMVTAPSRIRALVNRVQANPQFDKAGHQIGRSQMTLGLLYKIKKRRALALEHLTEARRILSQFGQTPILARVDAALAELGQ